MTSVCTTQTSSLLFRFFTIPFLLIITLALDMTIAHAESPFGSVPSDEKSLPAPSVVTILTRGMTTTPTQDQSRPVAGIGNVLRPYCPIGQHQIDDPGNRWHSLPETR